jgi:hypothetical protein
VLLLGALLMLAESFGRDVFWLSRQRHGARVVRHPALFKPQMQP